ncbi:alkene reductase, partial [Oceanospirillum sp. HFRX-1_2]
LLEVIEAVSKVWGADRVGVRLSPLNSFNSMKDSDPVGLMTWLSQKLSDFGLAYLHLMRADFLGEQQMDVVTPVREHYKGNLIVNMGYSPQEAQQVVSEGIADAVAFGVPFIANPDLPRRIKEGAELNQADPKTFYTQGREGYNDYPFLEELSPA